MVAALELTGKRFADLTVICRVDGKSGRAMWLCQCDCGGEATARSSSLVSGNTKSCGCLIRETMSRVGRSRATHNLSRTSEYPTWTAMKSRCYVQSNSRYEYYGAMGVSVCDRWRYSFENFLADMGQRPSPKHSIDRYPDNNGNYEPGNCRWATPEQQAGNRRPFKLRRVMPAQISAIRRDKRPDTVIAQETGYSARHIGSIKRGEIWPHITGEA